MRRILAVLLVIVLAVVPGCQSKQAIAESKVQARMAEADGLAAARSYDKAIEAYTAAASQMPSDKLREDALRKAAQALSAKVASQPLPAQVEAAGRFLDKLSTGLLPLSAHNWLSSRLVAESRRSLTDARKVWLAGAQALGRQTSSTSSSKKSTRSKNSKSATTTAGSRSAIPTASVAPIRKTGLKPAQLQQVARSLPALGQPPAMQKLYLALSTLAAETERADRERVTFGKVGPTRSSIRNLRDAETRLVRAISTAERLLAEAE